MTRDEAVVRIQEGLGFRTDLVATIIKRLQEAQRDVERGKTLPRFLIAEDQTLSLVQGTSSVALPDDFLRRVETNMRYRPSTSDRYVFVPWKNYDDAYKAYSNSQVAGPKVAVLRSSTIYFFPVADNNYTLTWDYYRSADLLDTNIENAWLENAPEILIGFAGIRMASDMRNKTALELFSDMYKTARMSWLGDTIASEQEDDIYLGADS